MEDWDLMFDSFRRSRCTDGEVRTQDFSRHESYDANAGNQTWTRYRRLVTSNWYPLGACYSRCHSRRKGEIPTVRYDIIFSCYCPDAKKEIDLTFDFVTFMVQVIQ